MARVTVPVFTVPEVMVEIERRKTGFLRARVIQLAADGAVYGRNMLAGQQITRVLTAEREVQDELRGKVKNIQFTFIDR